MGDVENGKELLKRIHKETEKSERSRKDKLSRQYKQSLIYHKKVAETDLLSATEPIARHSVAKNQLFALLKSFEGKENSACGIVPINLPSQAENYEKVKASEISFTLGGAVETFESQFLLTAEYQELIA